MRAFCQSLYTTRAAAVATLFVCFAQPGLTQVAMVDVGLELSISSMDAEYVFFDLEISNNGRDEYPGGPVEFEIFGGVRYTVIPLDLFPLAPGLQGTTSIGFIQLPDPFEQFFQFTITVCPGDGFIDLEPDNDASSVEVVADSFIFLGTFERRRIPCVE